MTEARCNPEVPFSTYVSFEDIDKITIKGTVLNEASRFNIWLQNGGSSDPDDVALVFDARFNFGTDYNTIVCNHKIEGNWGLEERNAPFFPFYPDGFFDIKIKLKDAFYQIKVNGQGVTEFFHKMPMQAVDTLRIDGDVELDEVKLK
ncbi:hypothetical protein ACJMK2_037483 [Sinanodonta woodiana]|uniref:Galectin n=1 Tax=Sinanodonta woodiana TaxID=1069815 RepID=A0ABD3WKH3_SINWO